MFKAGVSMLCCVLAVGLLGGAPETWAQAAAEESSVGLEPILVTAERRTTDVQRTAAAVTAYSDEDLTERTIVGIGDMANANASLLVSLFQGEAQIYIRGIGYSSVIGGSDSSTAFHSDGVYISRSAGAVPAFLDVERVEVLRGPQGTLYGRNATGGSVNVISKGPTNDFEAEGRLDVGNYDAYRVMGAIGGPLNDRIGVRIAVEHDSHKGYTTLYRPIVDPAGLGSVKSDAEDQDAWMARITVTARILDTLNATIKADYYEANDDGVVWHYFGPGTSTDPVYQALVPPSIRSAPYARSYGSDIQGFNKPYSEGISGKLVWNIDDYALSSLSAYRKTRPYNRDDLDVSPVFGVDQLREEDQHQFSQEFQLSSPNSGFFQWILGAYYFDEANPIRNEYFLPFTNALFGLPNTPDCCLLKLNGKTTTQAYAGFGEGTIYFTEKLQLVVGGRYSSELRGGGNDVVFVNAPVTAFDNVASFADTRFNSFTPKLGLNYELNANTFLYASASKGFKSGGFNPGSYQNDPYKPEQIWDYEAGVKLTLFDRRLRLNTAVFYYDYTDLQVQDVQNNNVIIRNAAKAKVEGLELESSWLATQAFRIDANLTWLDAEFTDGALLDPKYPALGVQQLSGKKLPRAPDLKATLGAQYQFDLRDQSGITLRVDYAWQDRIYFSAFNVQDLSERSYGWLKGRATYTGTSGKWNVAAYIDNATNEVVATNKIFNGDIIGSTVLGSLAPPRTFGVEFNVRY
ncbi:MAG: TonB-dependent receptor [Gammaproteobacteria bacterium]